MMKLCPTNCELSPFMASSLANKHSTFYNEYNPPPYED